MCLTDLKIISNNDFVQNFGQKIMTLTISFNNLNGLFQGKAYAQSCFLHLTMQSLLVFSSRIYSLSRLLSSGKISYKASSMKFFSLS